ncbi:MAG: hypothetical protein ACR2JB_05470 [Bryobacteraceae bacterium]
MNAREQYLETLRGEYQRASKRQKTRLLNWARKRTGLNRKVLVRKLAHPAAVKREQKQPVRGATYDAEVVRVLVRLWVLFDCPCGQRLAPALRQEVDRLLSHQWRFHHSAPGDNLRGPQPDAVTSGQQEPPVAYPAMFVPE